MVTLDYSNDPMDIARLKDAFLNVSQTVGDASHANKAINEWALLAKLNAMKAPINEEDVLLNQVADDKSKRFKYDWTSISNWKDLGPIWAESLTFYWYVLSGQDREEFESWLTLGRIKHHTSHEALVSTLKALSDMSKKYGMLVSPSWMKLINLEMLWRFGSTYDEKALHADAAEWFRNKRMSAPYRDTYYKHYRAGVKEFVTRFWQRPEQPPLTWEQWLASGRWGTTGATDGKRAYVSVQTPKGPKVVKANKTKNATLAVQFWQHYLPVLRDDNPQFNRITIKPDEAPNKTRLIVSSDTPNYLLMAYISTWFENHLSGESSSLYKNAAEMAQLWLQMAQEVDTDVTVKTPVDQSHFDHHATAEMIWIVLEEMERILPIGDLRTAMATLKANMFSLDAKCVFKTDLMDSVIPWRGGVPSGWRWTALMDTVVNWGQLWAAEAMLKDLGYASDIWSRLCQGDDIRLVTLDILSAVRYVMIYEASGLEVNASKFFIAKDRDEFLRRVANRGVGVCGYLARTVHSLLWRSPNSAGAGSMSLSEMLETWLVLIRRGADKEKALSLMLMDMNGASGIDKGLLMDWVCTPSSLGGGGVYDIGKPVGSWYSIKQEREYPRYKVVTPLNGITSLATTAGLVLSTKEKEKAVRNLVIPSKDYLPTKKEPVITRLGGAAITPLYPTVDAIYKLMPVWVRTFPIHLKDVLIDRIMSKGEDRWDMAYRYLEPSSFPTFDRLRSHASRNVLRKWLEGGLDYSVPKSTRFGTDFLRGVGGSTYSLIMKSALALPKLTMAKIQRVSLFIEQRIIFGPTLRQVLRGYCLNPDTVVISA